MSVNLALTVSIKQPVQQRQSFFLYKTCFRNTGHTAKMKIQIKYFAQLIFSLLQIVVNSLLSLLTCKEENRKTCAFSYQKARRQSAGLPLPLFPLFFNRHLKAIFHYAFFGVSPRKAAMLQPSSPMTYSDVTHLQSHIVASSH